MCGIVGVVGKIYKKEEDAFKLMLCLDTVRGPHSTGVVSVGAKEWEYLKVAGTPWELFEMKGFDKLMQVYHTALIGHNRWATVGNVTNDNAHPFAHGDFIGVHNGTLRSTKDLIESDKFETDSEAIYYHMSKEGPEETVKKLDGAFVLAWYNDDIQAVQLVRNKERPLYLCRSKDGFTYFFASEPWILKIALSKCGVDFNEPAAVETETLITIPCENTSYKKEPLLAKIKKVAFKEEIKVITYDYSYPYRNVTHIGDRKRPFVEKKTGDGLRKYLGKVVKFSVHKMMKVNNMDYVSCDLEEDDDTDSEIRVFVKPQSKLARRLLDSTDYFSAKVKKITDDKKAGNYLLVDNRTITEVKGAVLAPVDEAVEDEITGEYEVYNGLMVNADGWYRCTSKGCAWCSQFPKITEAKELVWFGHDQFICSDCKHEPEVMGYISQ